MPETKGLILVFTGDGKGKTTAALGMCLRAWGQGMRVLVVQFVKGKRDTGEFIAAGLLGPGFEIRCMGEGFTFQASEEEREKHRIAAQAAVNLVAREFENGRFHMIVMDEVLYAINEGLVTIQEILDLLKKRPAEVHLVLTGRKAPAEIIDKADLVTEMKKIRHHYEDRVTAQKGVEY